MTYEEMGMDIEVLRDVVASAESLFEGRFSVEGSVELDGCWLVYTKLGGAWGLFVTRNAPLGPVPLVDTSVANLTRAAMVLGELWLALEVTERERELEVEKAIEAVRAFVEERS